VTNESASILDLAVRLAHRAGEVQRDRYESRLEIRTKSSSIDLVTEVDEICEALIVEGIRDERPGDSILAEEGGGEEKPDSEWRWIIDPLDGTVNYAHGLPCFCVSIGVERAGVREVGVVYEPLRGELFHATRGGGAFLGERRLSVSRAERVAEALVATGFSYDVHTSGADNLGQLSAMLKSARGIRRDGSAALDLCYVAAGRFDAYWEFKLHPWDVAAGLLIVAEAGGHTTDLEGATAPDSGEVVVASNGRLHEELLGILRGSG
jgi:myo-inositol-1(or 4)-monophosphatase